MKGKTFFISESSAGEPAPTNPKPELLQTKTQPQQQITSDARYLPFPRRPSKENGG